jgi:hypothetical protein
MTTQAGYWTGAGAAAAIALVAGIADWRRTRRRNLDAPGWMPWRGVQAASFFTAIVLAVFATQS